MRSDMNGKEHGPTMTDLEQQYSAYRQKPGVCDGCRDDVPLMGDIGVGRHIMQTRAVDVVEALRTHRGSGSAFACTGTRCTALPILEWADQRDKAKDAKIDTLEDFAKELQHRVNVIDMADLKAKGEEIERLKFARRHTQEWYAQHYGKLHDWARKRLPAPWVTEFFHCVANGVWGHDDLGELYTCKAGFDIVPSNYFRTDTAEGQLILDQTQRAEDAELANASQAREIGELRAGLEGITTEASAIMRGEFGMDWADHFNPFFEMLDSATAMLSRTGEPQVTEKG